MNAMNGAIFSAILTFAAVITLIILTVFYIIHYFFIRFLIIYSNMAGLPEKTVNLKLLIPGFSIYCWYKTVNTLNAQSQNRWMIITGKMFYTFNFIFYLFFLILIFFYTGANPLLSQLSMIFPVLTDSLLLDWLRMSLVAGIQLLQIIVPGAFIIRILSKYSYWIITANRYYFLKKDLIRISNLSISK